MHLPCRFIEPDQSKKDYTKEMDERCKAEGIQFLYLPLEVNLVALYIVSHGQFPNDPSRVNRSLEAILSILLDRRNYPILINCLKGQVMLFVDLHRSTTRGFWWPASVGSSSGR